MIIDSYLDRLIGEGLVKVNEEKEAGHTSLGKLSASMLGWPLQWQILKSLGVPRAPIDNYTLRKFKRGEDIEEWLLSRIPTLERQKFVEYRNVVGYIDGVVETKDWDWKNGVIPLEVKSVTNAKYKRIIAGNGADRGHKLQAGLYGLALKSTHYAISYIASDDLRITTYVYPTEETREEIDHIIERYDTQRATGKIPVFVPEEKWQANPLYNNYSEWAELDEKLIEEKLKQNELQR